MNLQYCGGFCHTLTWISHGCTCRKTQMKFLADSLFTGWCSIAKQILTASLTFKNHPELQINPDVTYKKKSGLERPHRQCHKTNRRPLAVSLTGLYFCLHCCFQPKRNCRWGPLSAWLSVDKTKLKRVHSTNKQKSRSPWGLKSWWKEEWEVGQRSTRRSSTPCLIFSSVFSAYILLASLLALVLLCKQAALLTRL